MRYGTIGTCLALFAWINPTLGRDLVCPSDLGGDHQADAFDFRLFQPCITGPDGCVRGLTCHHSDLNGDRYVDLRDAAIFFNQFQQCDQCTPRWQSLGPQWTLPGTVSLGNYAMAVYDDGCGPALYVAGFIEGAGDTTAHDIAIWDGEAWSAFPNVPLSFYAHTLFAYDDGTGPALFAGGNFQLEANGPSESVVKWDGISWSVVGTGLDGTLLDFAIFDDGSGPQLYAAGWFQVTGGVSASIAKWDGSSWSFLFPEIFTAWTLAVFDDGSGPALYVGGEGGIILGQTYSAILRWDGATWSTLGQGLSTLTPNQRPSVGELAVHDDGTGLALFVGGEFKLAGGAPAQNIAKWDGQSWSAVGSGAVSTVGRMTVFDDGNGEALYATGFIGEAGGSPALAIGKWNGTTWEIAGGGLSGAPSLRVNSMTVFEDEGIASLYITGFFTAVGDRGAQHVARWDGYSWNPVGNGLTGTQEQYVAVTSMLATDDGQGPALFLGGLFQSTDLPRTVNVARWNGANRSALGPGIGAPVETKSAIVVALVSGKEEDSDVMYAAGSFATAGDQAAANIARWNGASWKSLGAGMRNKSPNSGGGDVLTLETFDDGTGSALFAGGYFNLAGETPANYIAKWDGNTWSALSSGVQNIPGLATVQALKTFDDGSGMALYVGGGFKTAGGISALNIARWDGLTWSAVGSGVDLRVKSLAVYDDGTGPKLIAAGSPSTFNGGGPAIAAWDGATWTILETAAPSTYPEFVAMAVFDDGAGPALFVGGGFDTVGGVPANNIARYDGIQWTAMGTGVDSNVYSMAVFDDGRGPALYVGGEFFTAGDIVSTAIARWFVPQACTVP